MAEQVYRFPLPGMAPCERCKGSAVVELRLHSGGTGYSVGSTHDHVPTCLAVVCQHGVPYSNVCDTCEDLVSAREVATGTRRGHEGDHECG
jgi:hypothetical protein